MTPDIDPDSTYEDYMNGMADAVKASIKLREEMAAKEFARLRHGLELIVKRSPRCPTCTDLHEIAQRLLNGQDVTTG